MDFTLLNRMDRSDSEKVIELNCNFPHCPCQKVHKQSWIVCATSEIFSTSQLKPCKTDLKACTSVKSAGMKNSKKSKPLLHSFLH